MSQSFSQVCSSVAPSTRDTTTETVWSERMSAESDSEEIVALDTAAFSYSVVS